MDSLGLIQSPTDTWRRDLIKKKYDACAQKESVVNKVIRNEVALRVWKEGVQQ